MKNLKRFILSLLLFFFIFSPTIVLAQPNQATTTGVRETVREEIREKTATVQAFLSERKQEIIRNHFSRVARRLTAAIERLNRLISRLESRLAKIEETNENLNTETIKADIVSGKEKLDQAGIQLENVKTKMNEIIESETPREGFVEIKEMVGEIRESLVEVHQILVKVIGDIKGLRVGE
ncbi:hypothetical protein COY29_06110 [Candidatus Woesebacteria bacterium CG_4_10_14_0_2_um_filter_39_14]|uniref:DUF5667 domain-containing protein n=1 Tax=Candidatus Woesebacteria bacterium CG_4_10_14_0_2_um_filter_39_14 TaxID=1975054 RepID=A0A2M7TJK1_9BACT|nr:MAG: hypothetical protein COY29_06110 [Candidatus Woesebacteria bacterium CG_4_10_14_0_2_um_filter_39_14]